MKSTVVSFQQDDRQCDTHMTYVPPLLLQQSRQLMIELQQEILNGLSRNKDLII